VPRSTSEFDAQDWILIVEALVQHAGPAIETEMEQRAWELVTAIAAEQGLPPAELVRQADY
jgi:hypothetical protein